MRRAFLFMPMRLQKFLADAGVASRRASEGIILEGRVEVNGKIVRELGTKIEPGQDRVRVDGQELKPKRKLYVALNKPPGYISTRSDPEGRTNVMQLLPREWSNLYSVGRLDFKSEGLLFFTNDGDFALRLTHPRYGVRKKYHVSVKGEVRPEVAQLFTKGVHHMGELLRAEEVRILKAHKGYSLVEVTLREGKNREIRRLFESQQLEIERLQRIQIGPIKLGQLPKGKWRTLTAPEIRSLLGNTA